MTVTVPNYFLQEKPESILSLSQGLYLKRASASVRSHRVRNTMHGLLVVLEGSKRLDTAGGSVELEAPCGAFFAQGNYFVSRNMRTYRALALYFDDAFAQSLLKEWGGEEGASEGGAVSVAVPLPRESAALHLAEALWRDAGGGAEVPAPLLRLRTKTLFMELLAIDPAGVAGFLHRIVAGRRGRFVKILEENLDIVENVGDMQRLLRMSPAHLHRRFMQELGIPPKRWLTARRLEKGAALLLGSDREVAQIAAECGYATPSWFIAAFKRYYGVTPLQYRREKRHF
ncbi:helix-turn-helix transcriptional regulator [Hydrogenimonas sp.]